MWDFPKIRSSFSSLSTPFWTQSTVVSGPTTGRTRSAAVSVSYPFTEKSTRSTTPIVPGSSVALGRTWKSPATLFTCKPSRCIAARCAPRAMNVTSSPAAANRPP